MKVKVYPTPGRNYIIRHPDQGYLIKGEMTVEDDKGIRRLQQHGEITLEDIQSPAVEEVKHSKKEK